MNIRNKINGIREIMRFDNRWEIIGKRLFEPNVNEITYRIGELAILTDHSSGDANGAREVITSKMYRQLLPLLDRTKPLNVLDIGANNGGFPLLLKLEGFEFNRLAAVEFNPSTFERLKTNIENNFGVGYKLLNAGLCGISRILKVDPSLTGTADSIYAQKPSINSVEIEGLTFDEILNRTFEDEDVDICKMDVEGAEFEVFENPGHAGIKRCRSLIIEIHQAPDRPREVVLQKLAELGFEELNGDNKSRPDRHYVHFFRNTQA